MRRLLVCLAIISIASPILAAGNQSYLGLFAETSGQRMAGMPMPQLPPGMDLESLKKMPGMEKMAEMFGGGSTRKLEVRLWSPGLAPADASAVIACPSGLKQGDKLILDIYRPKAEESAGETGGTTGYGTAAPTEMTIKYYWGSSPTVRPGQPKVFKTGSLTADQKRAMKQQQEKAQKSGSYFYKPNWTTGYWPTKDQPGQIAKDAALEGNYALTTNYTGNVSIDCPSTVNFLDGIDMSSPDMAQKIPFDAPIEFRWKQISNLLGSTAMVTGMIGRDTIIIWNSSEVWREDMMSIDWDYMQMADVKALVNATIMMKGDDTDATVPAGIFKDCDFVNMRMIGYGTGAATADTNPLARIQTKTTMSIMLGGKMQAGMGGTPGGRE